jgi:hypothetical protein
MPTQGVFMQASQSANSFSRHEPLFNVSFERLSQGVVHLGQLTDEEKSKLQNARLPGSRAAEWDLDYSTPYVNTDGIRKGEIVLVGDRYALVEKVNLMAVWIISNNRLYKVAKEHLQQIAKKLADRIPASRKLNTPACSIDKLLATPVKERSDMLSGQYVLVEGPDTRYRYARISRVMANEACIAFSDENPKRKIHKKLWSMLIQKIPPLQKSQVSSRTETARQRTEVRPKILEEKLSSAECLTREGKVLYQNQAFSCGINRESGNVILNTPLGKIEVNPVYVSKFDPKKDSGKFVNNPISLPISRSTSSRLQTNEMKQIRRLESRMQKMGIKDKTLISNVRKLFKESFNYYNPDNDIFMAILAANLIGDLRFRGTTFDSKPLEGMSSLDAIFFKFNMDWTFLNEGKRGQIHEFPKLMPFVTKLMKLREKLLISSLMTECARRADNDLEKERIINHIIETFQNDIKRVCKTPESGAWTAGYRGHTVIATYRRERNASMLRFSLQNTGNGTYYQKYREKLVINEFRIGNKLLEKYVIEDGRRVLASGFACDQSYIDNVLLEELIPRIVRLKVNGTDDEYLDFLEEQYVSQRVIDDNSAYLRTGVAQEDQNLGNCIFTSQEAFESKLAKDAGVLSLYPSFKKFCEEEALFMLASAMPDDTVFLSKLTNRSEKTLIEIIQICWEKHMALSRSEKAEVLRRKKPWNQTLGLPLSNPPIEVDVKKLLYNYEALFVTGKNKSGMFSNIENTMSLCFDKNINGGYFHVIEDKLYFYNSSDNPTLAIKTNGKVKELLPSYQIEITSGRYKRINLAPEKKEGFFLDLSPPYRHETLNERLFSRLMPSQQEKTNTKS